MPSREKQAFKLDPLTPNASGYGMQSSEAKDKVLDWGDVMFHKNLDRWPANPTNYKYVTFKDSVSQNDLVMKILISNCVQLANYCYIFCNEGMRWTPTLGRHGRF
jgi:hypothetical protein